MIRALLVASAAALAAGAAAVLALDAAADAWLRDGGATLTALAAIWVSQGVFRARPRRKTKPSKWDRVYGGKPMPEHIYIRRHRAVRGAS